MTISARMAKAARSICETRRSHRETVSGDVSSNSASVTAGSPTCRWPELDLHAGRTEQHAAIQSAGFSELHLEQWSKAHALFVRSTAMGEAEESDWEGRIGAAWKLKHASEVVSGLTVIARRWPDDLKRFTSEFVGWTADEIEGVDPEVRAALLAALFDARWIWRDIIEPSELWRDLARYHLGRNQLDRAAEVAARITDPYVLISMRVDHRFDPLVTDPAHFDINQAKSSAARPAHELRQFTGMPGTAARPRGWTRR